MHVYLFDIDGTLVSTGGAGRLAMAAAFTELFGGCDRVDGVPFSGRTDRVIARDLLLSHEREHTEENWSIFRNAYLKRLPSALEESEGELLPGVLPLLERLRRRDDVALGLLTGNLHEGAKLKLEYYGIYDHFAFGGFGDHHFERNDVARVAFESALRIHSAVTPDDVWVIGDTPLDVACARAIGAKAAAVATGMFTLEQLREHEPDLLLETLADVKEGSPLLPR